jgi:hypothetical protein
LEPPDRGFDDFFFSALPRVQRLAIRLTGNRQAAEDVAAEAFARAFARWPKVFALPYKEAWVLSASPGGLHQSTTGVSCLGGRRSTTPKDQAPKPKSAVPTWPP